MFKRILLSAMIVSITACSTVKPKEDEIITADAVKFAQDFGKVEVSFNDKGDWESIKSTASSFVPMEHDAALEQGMNVATMRAKRNIVEFLQSDLRSKKTTDTMTKALAQNISEDDVKSKQKAANIATEIVEKISVEGNGLIRGAFVSKREITPDAKNVSVTVTITKQSLQSVAKIRQVMR